MSEVKSGCAVRAAIQELNSTQLANTQFSVPVGPDINGLIYWVRKLVNADCADDAVAALAELRKIEKQIPADWPKVTTL